MTHQFDEFAFHPTSGWIVYRGNAAAKRMRHKGSFLFDRNPDFNGSVGIKDCVITASRPIFVNSIITEYLIRVNAFLFRRRCRMTIEFLCELDKQSLP